MLFAKLMMTLLIVGAVSLLWWWLMKDNALHMRKGLFVISIPLIIPLSAWTLLRIWLASLNFVGHRKQY
jgi:hypothetical protein